MIPEFNRISINDKVRLIRNHFSTTLCLNEASNPHAKYVSFELTFKTIFGTEIAMGLLRCIQIIQTYGHDPIVLKLVLIIECLSSGTTRYLGHIDMDRIYDDTKAIFVSQNIYVELLWIYILSRLPSEKYAVKFFNKLISDLLVIVDVNFMAETFVYCSSNEIDKMEPLFHNIWPRSKNK
jgi:hypothetical protein